MPIKHGKKLKSELQLQDFHFYWVPPKKYYDDDDLDFFEEEFGFVLGRVVILANVQEELEEYEADDVMYEMNHSYFFEVDQSDVPNIIRQKILIALLSDNENPHLKRFLSEKQ